MLNQFQASGPLASRAPMRPVELVDLDRDIWESGQDLELASQGLNDLSQRGNLHVGLVFELGQARLLHAQRLGNLLLALPRQLSNLAEKQFLEQFLSAARCLCLSLFAGCSLDKLVE